MNLNLKIKKKNKKGKYTLNILNKLPNFGKLNIKYNYYIVIIHYINTINTLYPKINYNYY